MDHEDISKFYRNTVGVIYGVIIGLSFTQIGSLFTPLDNLSQSEYLIDAFAAMFAYFFIITSWIGYHRSVTSYPHRGKVGNVRFAVDLFIVFLSYYLVNLVSVHSNEELEPLANYSDTFVWIMPAIFLAFIVWDILKYIEYWDQRETRKLRMKRMLYSLIVGLIFIGMSFCTKSGEMNVNMIFIGYF